MSAEIVNAEIAPLSWFATSARWASIDAPLGVVAEREPEQAQDDRRAEPDRDLRRQVHRDAALDGEDHGLDRDREDQRRHRRGGLEPGAAGEVLTEAGQHLRHDQGRDQQHGTEGQQRRQHASAFSGGTRQAGEYRGACTTFGELRVHGRFEYDAGERCVELLVGALRGPEAGSFRYHPPGWNPSTTRKWEKFQCAISGNDIVRSCSGSRRKPFNVSP